MVALGAKLLFTVAGLSSGIVRFRLRKTTYTALHYLCKLKGVDC